MKSGLWKATLFIYTAHNYFSAFHYLKAKKAHQNSEKVQHIIANFMESLWPKNITIAFYFEP